MGLRYRKSINLGGGFRINLSKSGVGYSWGVRGYRITKTARGSVRQTVSIPGTGISYSTESKARKSQVPSRTSSIDTNRYATEEIRNNNASAMVSDGLNEILSLARKTILADKMALWGMILSLIFTFNFPGFIIFFLLFTILKVYSRTGGRIDLEYEIDDDQRTLVAQRLNPMLQIAACNGVWRIMQSSKVINRKYSGGAGSTVMRTACKAMQKSPFPFKTNTPVATFKAGKETLAFFPDKLVIIQKRKLGALNYSDISTSTSTTRFIEDKTVPKDTAIVGRTWQYVNKSGGPDRRFKNNRQLPICLYGELKLQSPSGLNTIIMFSNPNLKYSK